jgi:methionyl-tRNA synthetase
VEVSRGYDRDALVFYLLYDVAIGLDGDFSWERFKGTWEKMLIGGRGNLVNRVANLGKKYGVVRGKFDEKRFKEYVNRHSECNEESFLSGLLHFVRNDIEEKYLDSANTKSFVEDWYKLVQLANEYITKAEPRKKYKDETTRQEAIEDLEFLLRVIKQLGLLSAPLLVNGFVKLQKILGNEQISALDSSVNGGGVGFEEVFDAEEFEVNLEPIIMYEKKE